MSKAIDMADLIRNRLLTRPAVGEMATSVDLTHIDVIIDRQVAVLSKVKEAVAKASGCAIVIVWTGFQVDDKNLGRPRLSHRYTITVWSKQVVDQGNRPADNVIESIVLRLWHWVPDGGHAFGEAEVINGDMVPDKSYLIYDCEVIIPTQL
ncbi:MAG: hypothetical protein Q8Q59_06335 [Luteolibacter sp.]|jgi:hypothetical protein|nr:hypothetical protein [Luteolibacter sp.]